MDWVLIKSSDEFLSSFWPIYETSQLSFVLHLGKQNLHKDH